MRRIASALVVAVVACVTLAAAVDAVRGDRETPVSHQSPEPRRPDAATSFGGTLVWIDRGCELHAVSLPSLQAQEQTHRIACTDDLEPSGRLVPKGAAWRPGGGLLASCADGSVNVSLEPGGPPLLVTPGCTPAWRPDGTLTYADHGELRLSSRLWDRRVLLARADLRRAAGRGAHVVRAAWLDDRRVAVVVRAREGTRLVVFDGRRAVAPPIPVPPPVESLTTSPRGGYAVAETAHGLLVVSRDGRPIGLPFADASDLVFSPDERWALAAEPHGTFLFRPGELELRVRHLPVRATQLAWIE